MEMTLPPVLEATPPHMASSDVQSSYSCHSIMRYLAKHDPLEYFTSKMTSLEKCYCVMQITFLWALDYLKNTLGVTECTKMKIHDYRTLLLTIPSKGS